MKSQILPTTTSRIDPGALVDACRFDADRQGFDAVAVERARHQAARDS